jgi:hypothetical protein
LREPRKARSDTGARPLARALHEIEETAWRCGNIALAPRYGSIFRTFAGGPGARGVAIPHQGETLLTAD